MVEVARDVASRISDDAPVGACLRLLDSQRRIFVERKGLLTPYYWYQRVLSQVPDFDEGVCRDPRRSSLPSLRIWCCEDETGCPKSG